MNAFAVFIVTRGTWWSHLMSFDDRLEIAWSAMVEKIEFSGECPSSADLWAAARSALQRQAQMQQAAHGSSNGDKDLAQQGLHFHRYWWQRHASGFDQEVTEAVALGQIWDALTPRQQTVLIALRDADCDVRAAAESLEMSLAYFRQLLREARTHFLGWWHEGETPSGIWMQDGPPISSIALMSTLRRRKRSNIAAATATQQLASEAGGDR